MDYCECIVLSTGLAHLTSIVLLQVRTAMSMRHAARWFQQESRSGWTPAPSVAAMMARMLVTGRETVWPPARASKTARLKRCPPRKTDWLGTSRAHTQYHIKTTTISIVERTDWIVKLWRKKEIQNKSKVAIFHGEFGCCKCNCWDDKTGQWWSAVAL